ncbi:MAG: hypothetical protein AB1734_09275 [Elusimicrobiota bacterium]|jgi:hypothetical protein
MKLIPQTLVLIGLPMSAFALPPEIHFDGGGRNENILAVINEITVTAADAPHLGMVLKVKTSPGNWKNLSPVKTEKNTVYYETHPGSEFQWELQCTNNNDIWNFTMWHRIVTWADGAPSSGHRHPSGSFPDLPSPLLTFHNGGNVPLPFYSGNIQPNSVYSLDFKAPAFAAAIEFLARSAPCGDGSTSAIVDVKNEVELQAMTQGSEEAGYLLTPVKTDIDHHPSVHNGTPGFLTALKKIGSHWAKTCHKPLEGIRSGPLRYLRISLPWGGSFDRDCDWKEPYYKHDRGVAADISKTFIRPGNRQGLINLMCNLGLEVYSERGLDGSSYYHVTPHIAGTTDSPPDSISCCMRETGQYPSPFGCINHDQGDYFPPPSTPDCPDLPSEQDVKSRGMTEGTFP